MIISIWVWSSRMLLREGLIPGKRNASREMGTQRGEVRRLIRFSDFSKYSNIY